MDPYKWIRESCEEQNAITPEDFIGMGVAYVIINTMGDQGANYVLSLQSMIELASVIKGDQAITFRTTPVTFADGGTAVHPQHIQEQLNKLFKAYMDPTANVTIDDFYQRFEEIHPFTDENGRVGALLYNWLNCSLEDPIHPPAFRK